MKVVINWKPRVNPPKAFQQSANPQLPQLHYPFDTVPRTAILGSGFDVNGDIRVFPEGWSPALAKYAPDALAAPARTLQWLIRAVDQGHVSLPPLGSAVIAFVGEPYGKLTPADRELIERIWGVPVFEQYRAASGELLAAECSAHRGLHVRDSMVNVNEALRQFVSLDRTPCQCGSDTPRLLPAGPALTHAACAGD
jgi:hypothetical protein